MSQILKLTHENQQLKRQINQYQQVLGVSPYVDDSLFKGGYRVVKTIDDRNNIDCCHSKQGMIVCVIGEDLSFKEYRLISDCKNKQWEEIQTQVTENDVILTEDYSDLSENLTTQKELNLVLKQLILNLQTEIDNIELIDEKVQITENTGFAQIGQTQKDFNKSVSNYKIDSDLKNQEQDDRLSNIEGENVAQNDYIYFLQADLYNQIAINANQDERIVNLEGINYTWNPKNRTLTLFDSNGIQLSQVSLVSLDNEGTDIRYNASTLSLELYNADNELLDSIPVSSFIGSVGTQLQLNSNQLQLKDSQGNVLSSVSFEVSNINGLQIALNSKLDKGTYTGTAQDLKNSIDGIQIGGRNLLLNTKSDWQTFSGTGYGLMIFPKITAKINETFTARVFVRNSNSPTPITLEIHELNSNSERVKTYDKQVVDGVAEKTITTENVNIAFLEVNLFFGDSYGKNTYQYEYSKPKLERGNKATDWTPAPEDKLNKPTSTGNTTSHPFVVGEDGNGNSARLPAGDLGKNFFNSDLSNTTARNHTMNAGVTVNTLGNPHTLAGLPNKNTDVANFRKVRVQNTSGLDAISDSKTVVIDAVTSMTDTEKDAWRLAQRKTGENYNTSAPQISVINPFLIKNTDNFPLSVVVTGGNLFIDLANSIITMKRVKDVYGQVVSDQPINITANVSTNSINNTLLLIYYNFYNATTGYYEVKIQNHYGLQNLTSPQFLVVENYDLTPMLPFTVINSINDLVNNTTINNNSFEVNLVPNVYGGILFNKLYDSINGDINCIFDLDLAIRIPRSDYFFGEIILGLINNDSTNNISSTTFPKIGFRISNINQWSAKITDINTNTVLQTFGWGSDFVYYLKLKIFIKDGTYIITNINTGQASQGFYNDFNELRFLISKNYPTTMAGGVLSLSLSNFKKI